MSKQKVFPKFTLNRDKVLSTTLGHTIEFKKGVPTHVPPELYAEVQAIGALPSEDLPTEEEGKAEPLDPIARRKAIMDVFEKMTLANSREDFTASGLPHAKALARELGFSVDNKERDTLWQEFTQGEGK